jgi:hypothetical protein
MPPSEGGTPNTLFDLLLRRNAARSDGLSIAVEILEERLMRRQSNGTLLLKTRTREKGEVKHDEPRAEEKLHND